MSSESIRVDEGLGFKVQGKHQTFELPAFILQRHFFTDQG
jgi:hypothetical protein